MPLTEVPPRLLLGYARVSQADQNPQLQFDALTQAGVAEPNIYCDTASGGSMKREALKALLRDLRPGDVVVVWKLDRLSRQLADLIAIIQLIHRHGASFRSLTEAVNTGGPMGEFTLQILGAVAQFERALIRERTRAGLARAKAEGRVGGRRPTYTEDQIRHAKALRERGEPWDKAAESIGISVTRLQARIRALCPTQ